MTGSCAQTPPRRPSPVEGEGEGKGSLNRAPPPLRGREGWGVSRRFSAALWRFVPLLVLALAWEAAPRLGLVSPAALPPLSAVLRAWSGLLLGGDLVSNGASSIVNPLIRCLYPLPKSALIPVLILWLGIGAASKIAAIFIGCLLPVTISAYNGARGVDETLVWSALASGASRARVLW